MENRPWHRHYDYNVPTTIRCLRISAQGLLELSAKAYPDKAALSFYGTEIGFWNLRQTGIRMANALAAIGVQKGDRVGIHLPTCPQYVIAYLATLSLGAIVVNLNPMYTAEELKTLITDTGVTTLFTFDMVLPNIRPLYQDIELPRVIVTKMTDYHYSAIFFLRRSIRSDIDLLQGLREVWREGLYERVIVNPWQEHY